MVIQKDHWSDLVHWRDHMKVFGTQLVAVMGNLLGKQICLEAWKVPLMVNNSGLELYFCLEL